MLNRHQDKRVDQEFQITSNSIEDIKKILEKGIKKTQIVLNNIEIVIENGMIIDIKDVGEKNTDEP